MTKVKLRQQAIDLRKQDMSYSQIKQIQHVSKSTLSIWLKGLPLSKERINELRGRSEKRIERFRKTMLMKKHRRILNIYNNQKAIITSLSKRELFLSGLFLYWGEGNKSSPHSVSINNSDPSVVKFALLWITKCLGVDKEKIRAFLHLYKDMNVKLELNYWSKVLDLPLTNFNKPYIKESKRTNIDHKGFGHGTCGVVINNTRIKEKVTMSIKVIKDMYSKQI